MNSNFTESIILCRNKYCKSGSLEGSCYFLVASGHAFFYFLPLCLSFRYLMKSFNFSSLLTVRNKECISNVLKSTPTFDVEEKCFLC